MALETILATLGAIWKTVHQPNRGQESHNYVQLRAIYHSPFTYLQVFSFGRGTYLNTRRTGNCTQTATQAQAPNQELPSRNQDITPTAPPTAEPHFLRLHEPRQSYSNVLMFYSTYNKQKYSRPLFVQKYLKRLQLAFVSHSAYLQEQAKHIINTEPSKKKKETRRKAFFFLLFVIIP